MKVLAADGPAPHPDRPATQLLHDHPDGRVVSFLVSAGQVVPPHTSASTVIVQILEGVGRFRGEGSEVQLGPGRTAVYEPGELHSMEPVGEGSLRFLAIITPRPA